MSDVNVLDAWARTWGVPDAALDALRVALCAMTMPDVIHANGPEAEVQKAVRLEAAEKGHILWRNNVGLSFDESGNPIRFGLANDSAKMNKHVKSADLVGIRRVLVTPDMVGKYVGIFLAREVKRSGWKFTGSEREKAQANFLTLVYNMGGDAGFAAGVGTI